MEEIISVDRIIDLLIDEEAVIIEADSYRLVEIDKRYYGAVEDRDGTLVGYELYTPLEVRLYS